EPAIRADLVDQGIDRPEALFRYLRLGTRAAAAFAGEGPEDLDLHPRLECSAPLGLFDGTSELQLLLASAGRLRLDAGGPSPSAGQGPGDGDLIEKYRSRGGLLQKLDADLSAWNLSAAMDLFILIRREEDPWLWAAAAQLVGRWSLTRSPDQGRLLLRRALLVLDAPGLRRAYGEIAGETDDALLKHAGREASERDWTAHLLLAQQALDTGDAKAAMDFANEARRRGAPLRRVCMIEGSAHGIERDLAAAERSFQEALAAAGKGERGDIFYNLGIAREKGRDYLGAIEYQRLAMAEGADPVLAGVALARALRAAGRSQEAFAVAEQASSKNKSAEAFFQAAQALIDQGMLAEALGWMKRAAEADRESYQKDLETLQQKAPELSPGTHRGK